MRYLDVYLLHLAVINGIACLRLKLFRIPPSYPSGRDAVLSCEYDLEGEDLYCVKWFHNGQEFYRFAPHEDPETMFFPTRGIKLDMRRTTNTSVVLRDLELRTTGVFRCVVSTDAPLFRTVTAEALMTVGDYYSGGISSTISSLCKHLTILITFSVWINKN